jgi:hypothetical protein
MTAALVYFAYLGGLALVVPVSSARRVIVLGVSIATLACVTFVGAPSFLPLAYLLIGYWLPALLARSPNIRLEQRLLALDRAAFGADGLSRFAERAPRLVVEYLELAYLMCYIVVPAGFLWLVYSGFAAESARFWAIVLTASFFCYGLLPLLPTRAPRALVAAPPSTRSRIRTINLAVLGRASVQWNTFPSGHSAASAATALAVGAHLPAAGCVLMAVALSIAAGSVAGRYHYLADAVTGVLVAVAAYLMASAVPGL